jgi:hypothetical protein
MFDSSVAADQRLLAALGAVTIDFAKLEAAIQLAIGFMLTPDGEADMSKIWRRLSET